MKNIKNKPFKKIFSTAVAFSFLFFASAQANQSDLVIYPGKGQSPEQQKQDELACRQWAMEQTGHDPTQQPLPQVQMKTSVGGQLAKGAVGGALLGTGIGAIAGNAGAGAAIGAGAGGAVLGAKESKSQKQRDAEYKQYRTKYNSEVAKYNKARKACFEGRGYSVK